MKKVKLLLLIVLCNFSYFKVLAQHKLHQGSFMINGKVDGRDTGIISLMYTNSLGKSVNDTTFLKNGEFHFTGSINEPTLAILRGDIKTKLVNDPDFVRLFLEPANMQVNLKEGDFAHLKVTGSKTQDELSKLKQSEDPFDKSADSILKERSQVVKLIKRNGKSPELDQQLSNLNSKLGQISEKTQKIEYDFLTTHPDSFLSPYFLGWPFMMDLPLDSVNKFYNSFSARIKNSAAGKDILSKIKAKAGITIGSEAQNFTAKDINGNVFSLKDFKHKKYVLLDFWASWCKPCKREIAYLKKLYALYHDEGLEIISISSDRESSVWKATVEQEKMGEWYNMMQSSVQLKKDELPMDLKFPGNAVPTVILIDQDGLIKYREVGFNEETGLKGLEEILMTNIKIANK